VKKYHTSSRSPTRLFLSPVRFRVKKHHFFVQRLVIRERYFIFVRSEKNRMYEMLFSLIHHQPFSKEGVNPDISGSANSASTPLPHPDVTLSPGIDFLLRTRVPKFGRRVPSFGTSVPSFGRRVPEPFTRLASLHGTND
jgi:hypothetical protein